MGAGAEDSLALVGQVSDVGELMAVELEHGAESLLLVPLTGEAVGNIVHILVKNIDLRLVVESALGVVVDSGVVGSDVSGVLLVVPLGLSDSLGELKNLKSEGLNSDNLIRVDVDLFLIAVLIREWGIEVEVVHGVVVVLWHDGAVVSSTSLGGSLSGGLNLSLSLSGDFGSDISAQVKGLGGESKNGKSSSEFHSCKFILYSKSDFRATYTALNFNGFS